MGMGFKFNVKTEGGHSRGHSNMAHRERTERIKKECKRASRYYGKKEIAAALVSEAA